MTGFILAEQRLILTADTMKERLQLMCMVSLKNIYILAEDVSSMLGCNLQGETDRASSLAPTDYLSGFFIRFMKSNSSSVSLVYLLYL